VYVWPRGKRGQRNKCSRTHQTCSKGKGHNLGPRTLNALHSWQENAASPYHFDVAGGAWASTGWGAIDLSAANSPSASVAYRHDPVRSSERQYAAYHREHPLGGGSYPRPTVQYAWGEPASPTEAPAAPAPTVWTQTAPEMAPQHAATRPTQPTPEKVASVRDLLGAQER